MVIAVIANAFIHLMASALVVGGEVYMLFVAEPAVKDIPPPEGGRINEALGKGFSIIAWTSAFLILVTGVVRSVGLKLFNADVLFGSAYGNLLVAKIVLFAVIIINAVIITRTAIKISKLAGAGGAPPVEEMQAHGARIRTLSTANLTIATIAILLAVAMRVIGSPTL